VDVRDDRIFDEIELDVAVVFRKDYRFPGGHANQSKCKFVAIGIPTRVANFDNVSWRKVIRRKPFIEEAFDRATDTHRELWRPIP
jgi:hypothetical protein